MQGRLASKLIAWSAAALAGAFAIDLLLDYLGWANTPGAEVELAFSAGLVVILFALAKRLVIDPLKQIEDMAHRVQAGDLSARVHIDSSKELSIVSGALNSMVEELSTAYEQLKSSSLTLERAVEERSLAVTVERDKLSSIFKNIPDGLIFIGISGEVLEVNPMMESIWGLKAGELIGKAVDELPGGPLKDSLVIKCKGGPLRRCWEVHNCNETKCPAYMSDDVRCWLISGTFCRKGVQTSVRMKRETVCSGCAVYREVMQGCSEVREVNVADRHYKVSGALVLDKNQKVAGEIKTFTDVTEEKLLERKKADFISLVTHDLKSPLTSIIGYTDLILTEEKFKVMGETEEFVKAIRASGKRQLEMVEQYLDLSKIEAGMLELKLRPVSIVEILDMAITDLAPQMMEKRISLTRDLAPGLPAMYADREKMVRVVSNIISNAIKYNPAGGGITVTGNALANGPGRPRVEICVTDTGHGIAEDELPHVFDRYYRSGKNSMSVKGAGLGLAVVKSLVEAQDGEVSVESEPGKGSTFIVRMPVAE